MTNKILKSILSVAAVVLISSLMIITGVLYQYFGNIQKKQLRDELVLASRATEQLGMEYLNTLQAENYRVTWIASDGKVLFDSHAEANEMENHSGREEVEEAFASGNGSSIRHSVTLTQKTMYEAARLTDGSVLRMSVHSATALVLIFGMLQPIALIAIIMTVFSVFIARSMAKRVVDPLNRLDLEKPLENDTYEELSPLLHRIHAQHQEIRFQIKKLKEKQNEFDKITGDMKEALVLLDRTGRIISINPAAKKIYGIHTDCSGADFLTLDRRQDMRKALETVKETGHSCFRTKKNGRDYQFEVTCIDADGTIQGTVILAFDVTEQIRAEQHRREFTANVSHELKTPLQSIIGAVELMEAGIVKKEDEPVFLGNIRKEASRMVTLINDIIRLSQLDEGAEMPREEISLLALAEEVRDVLSDAAKRKDVTMTVNGDAGMVLGVRRLLYEVIYNLCDNAIKYNNPGGYVKINISSQSDSVRVDVCDNGIGVSPENHDKIFERFFCVDKSHSKKTGGTGLGLSIVKHAVQYHQGRIEMESELDHGTTISVILDGIK